MEYMIAKESSHPASWALYKRQRGHKAWERIASGLTQSQAHEMKGRYANVF